MPRAPRIEFENACYHVMARGNHRQAIVFDDADRKLFTGTMGEAAERCGWEIFAWVLMDNHYHLVFRTPEANLVEGMQWMQNTYTRRLNARHRLWGHLFGGRYRSILVENRDHGGKLWQDYLRTVIDYVHMNPSRAGLVDGWETSIRKHSWNSVSLGHALAPSKRPDWLMTEEVLELHGERDSVAGRRHLVEHYDAWSRDESEKDPEIEGVGVGARVRRGWFWGSESFREEMLLRLEREGPRQSRDYRASETVRDHNEKRAREILSEAETHFGASLEILRVVKRGDWTRAAIAWAIWRETIVSQRWIAEELNLKSAANASQQIRRFAKLHARELPKLLRSWKQSRNVD